MGEDEAQHDNSTRISPSRTTLCRQSPKSILGSRPSLVGRGLGESHRPPDGVALRFIWAREVDKGLADTKLGLVLRNYIWPSGWP